MHRLLVATGLLISPAALAGTPAQIVEAELAREGVAQPQLLVACSPTSKVMQLAAGMAPTLAMMGGDESPLGPVGSAMMMLGAPDGMAEQGFDPDGVMLISTWDEDTWSMALPFAGDDAQADAFLVQAGLKPAPVAQGEDPAASDDVVAAPAPVPVMGDVPRSRVDDGRIVLWEGEPEAAEGAPGMELAPLVKDLPSVDACVLVMGVDDAPTPELGAFKSSMFIPLSGGAPGLVRFQMKDKPPAMLARSTDAPMAVSSTLQPSAVVTMGVPPLELVKALRDISPRPMPEFDTSKIDKRLSFPGGVVVGFYGNPRAMDVAAVVPVNNDKGKPYKTWKLLKRLDNLAEDEGIEMELLSKDTATVVMEGKVVLVKAQKGRVVLGTNHVAVEQVADGIGQPWVSQELSAFAMEWPFTMSMAQEQGPAGNIDMKLGFRGKDDMFEVAVDVKGLDMDSFAGQSMMSGLGAGVSMAMAQAKREAEAREALAQAMPAPDLGGDDVGANVDGLCVAQAAYYAAFDEYVPLAVHPRPAEQVDANAVAWGEPEDYARVGWRPESEKVRGSYQAVVAEDGQSVSIIGVADVDGDGVPARFECLATPKGLMNGGAQQLSDDGVR